MEKSTDHEFYQHVPRPVGAMAKSYPGGYPGYRHEHVRAQFLYAESGTMKVTTDRGSWIVPPHRATAMPVEYDRDGFDGRLIALMLEEISWSPAHIVVLPELRDLRLLRIEEALKADPADARTLSEWAGVLQTSTRTLTRLFLKETNMCFRCWRDQFRVLAALPRLAERIPITALALDFGYETPSAFSAMFRRVMGMTPSQYLAEETTCS